MQTVKELDMKIMSPNLGFDSSLWLKVLTLLLCFVLFVCFFGAYFIINK